MFLSSKICLKIDMMLEDPQNVNKDEKFLNILKNIPCLGLLLIFFFLKAFISPAKYSEKSELCVVVSTPRICS